MKILHVEDDIEAFETLKNLGERKFKDKVEFANAPDGETALKMFNNDNYHFVILDIDIPLTEGGGIPEITGGIDIFEQIIITDHYKIHQPTIYFLTAYDQTLVAAQAVSKTTDIFNEENVFPKDLQSLKALINEISNIIDDPKYQIKINIENKYSNELVIYKDNYHEETADIFLNLAIQKKRKSSAIGFGAWCREMNFCIESTVNMVADEIFIIDIDPNDSNVDDIERNAFIKNKKTNRYNDQISIPGYLNYLNDKNYISIVEKNSLFSAWKVSQSIKHYVEKKKIGAYHLSKKEFERLSFSSDFIINNVFSSLVIFLKSIEASIEIFRTMERKEL